MPPAYDGRAGADRELVKEIGERAKVVREGIEHGSGAFKAGGDGL
jgi:hypothetical protein